MPSKPTYEALQRRVRTLQCEIRRIRQALAALRQRGECYRRMIHNAPLGILTIDRQGRILEVNPKTVEILGSPSAAATQAINVLEFPLLVESGIAEDIRRCLETGTPMVADHPYVTKWGREIHLRYHLTPIEDANGQIAGVGVIHEDFTQLKRAEATVRQQREQLEDEVRQRTTELTQANARLTRTVQKLESRTNAIVYLNELSELLQACNTEAETYTSVASICQRLFPTDSGYLSILDNPYRLLRVVASWGTPAGVEPEFDQDDCWAIRRGKVHCVLQPGIDPLCRHHHEIPKVGCLCAPMHAQGEVLGVLHMCLGEESPYPYEAEHAFEAKKMLLVSIAERYSPSLTSLRLRETLRSQSIRDPLTGLYNRRHMEGSLMREERRARRRGTPLGIIVIDVDHFKAFNDRNGHDAGDHLLRELGAFLIDCTRGEDIACRYGGEEFTIILPEASLENTRSRAEELRRGVKEKLRIRHGQVIEQITVSLGVAVFPEHGESAKEALKSADRALYAAKAAGRDRVAVAAAVHGAGG
jgi:diguanylate cyclase (GGDEF)-like protein/PAS domain S-box-containing protein